MATACRLVMAMAVSAALHGWGLLAANAQPAAANAEAQVYLLRGLLNVFSLGMDGLADKLKPHGFQPQISSWEFGPEIADKLATDYANGRKGHIFLIGHSLGANTTFDIADRLQKKNIPVSLVVTFDPTISGAAPSNVASFVNFYARDGFGHQVTAGPNFTGELDNLDLTADKGITHSNIDARDQFHQFVITKMLEVTTPKPARKPHHTP